jgi:Fe/S biogenesis protein NfuA
LIEVTEQKEAVLEFGGGCNGCSQVDVTLKNGIEKQMLEEFAGELSAIKDSTDHQSGEHSYY